MAETFLLQENTPFPNNSLPVLYYAEELKTLTKTNGAQEKVKDYLKKNNYSNSWVGGILAHHHFHSNTHEVLVCIKGTATVQLGGPNGDVYPFRQGDVLLLPAGTAHKKIEATQDFQIVGAYPNGLEYDMQTGDEEKYNLLKERIAKVPLPEQDPVEGDKGPVFDYWQ